ncbi:MAG TPA: Abi-alpha family protein [Aeromicrobium sp.]|nr:Abi-alpha family protein [Aeromicrobium sp.]
MSDASRSPALWEDAVGAAPGVARIAGRAYVQTARWALGTGARSARNLARAMTDPAAAGEFVRDLADDVAGATRAVAGVASAVASGVPLQRAVFEATVSFANAAGDRGPSDSERLELTLRERGEELLRKSRDVWNDDTSHPAYDRILDELAPDEARILLLLLRGGPQPSVDVRTGGPTSVLSSSLVASGLTMIGPRAGLRYAEEVPAYLNNLFRLGLIWFSREQMDDPLEYQVVEAQPDVLAAMHSVRFARPVRRSIHLTPFGVNFCTACLVDAVETVGLPEHQVPDTDS